MERHMPVEEREMPLICRSAGVAMLRIAITAGSSRETAAARETLGEVFSYAATSSVSMSVTSTCTRAGSYRSSTD